MKNKELIKIDVPIPTSDGKKVAHTIQVEVPARFDEDYQDYILDGEALAKIERVKARHMGLLSPEEIKALRSRLGVTQKEIADLLQIGAKSWSRWENGRERPSRSMNILLKALSDKKIDPNYLRSLRDGTRLNMRVINFLERRKTMANRPLAVSFREARVCENEVRVA